MKKISFCYTPTGGHCRTMFFEDDLSHHNALKMYDVKKASDRIEVLGGPKVEIPKFYDKALLNSLVEVVSNHFGCEVDYNNTSLHTDRTDKPH